MHSTEKTVLKNVNARMTRRNHAAWLGPLLTLLGIVTYFAVAVKFPDLRDSAIVNLVLVAAGALVAFWGLVRRRNWKSWLGFTGATAFAGLFFWYIFAYSSQLPTPDTAPAVGSMAPPLKLPDETGRMLSLDDLRGDRVLVVFYRGYW